MKKKRRRILHAGGLGVSPSFIKSPVIARNGVPEQSPVCRETGKAMERFAGSRETDRSADISTRPGDPVMIFGINFSETAEKEVQDTSCRGSGGVPQLQKSPKIGGFRGLIKSISEVPMN